MRGILGGVVVLVAACGFAVAGQGKIDAAKLVGKWAPAPSKDKKEKPLDMLLEFAADGKLSMTVGAAGTEYKALGTYELTGNKLAVVIRVGEKSVKDTLTVKKLTDTELTTEDSKGKEETLRRKR
jgi:uncharacterized protein (TIGR03066 family)